MNCFMKSLADSEHESLEEDVDDVVSKQIQIQHIHGLQSKAFYVIYHNFHTLGDQVD